jgi:hypothetical protein
MSTQRHLGQDPRSEVEITPATFELRDGEAVEMPDGTRETITESGCGNPDLSASADGDTRKSDDQVPRLIA